MWPIVSMLLIRNSRGEAVAGCFSPLEWVLSPATAEALAFLKGLDYIEQLGCKNVMVESDSMELIQACNGTVEVCSPDSAILAGCFSKANNIENISFQHCWMQIKWRIRWQSILMRLRSPMRGIFFLRNYFFLSLLCVWPSEVAWQKLLRTPRTLIILKFWVLCHGKVGVGGQMPPCP
jgi:hypothetical protein